MTERSRGTIRRLVTGGTFAIAAAAVSALAPGAASAQAGTQLGVDTANFDRSVRPQDDFFRFVNGGWLTKTQIPQDAASWGSFNELREGSRAALHSIVDSVQTVKAPAGSEVQKVRDLYASFMDTARVEALGLTPLQPELRYIARVTSVKQLPATFAHFARIGVQTPIAVSVGADAKSSMVNIVQVGQSGLGMPDRDYYLKNDDKLKVYREKYVSFVGNILGQAGDPAAARSAREIFVLETRLARAHWTNVENRDAVKTYNKVNVADLAKQYPGFDWPRGPPSWASATCLRSW